MPEKSPQIRIWLLILTIIYLIFELSFSARLLDILGSEYNQDIKGIEVYGRIFSGIAFSLLFFKTVFKKYSVGAGIRKMIKIVILSILMMWGVQEALLWGLKLRYDDSTREKMTHLSLSAGLVAKDKLKLDGFNLSDMDQSTGSFKSFIALYPYLYQHNEKLLNLDEATKSLIVEHQVTESCDITSENYNCLGTHEDFFNIIWMPLRQRVIEKIEQEIATYEYEHTDGARQAAADKQWESFKEALEKKTGRPLHTLKGLGWRTSQVRSVVRKELSPYLSKRWDVNDMDAFKTAYKKKHPVFLKRELSKRFENPLPKKLTTQWIFNQPEMQWIINQIFNVVGEKVLIIYPHDEENVARDLARLIPFKYAYDTLPETTDMYKKLIAHHKQWAQVATAFKPKDDRPLTERDMYRKDISSEALGKYLDRIIIPLMALMFSLMGGLLHLIKLSVLSISIGISLRSKIQSYYNGNSSPIEDIKARQVAAGLTIIILLPIFFVLPMYMNNQITNSSAFTVEVNNHNFVTAKSMQWVINTQEFMYPVNNFLRRDVLKDMKFEAFIKEDEFNKDRLLEIKLPAEKAKKYVEPKPPRTMFNLFGSR